MQNETQPTQIVILGGSGDLSKRKLLPALLDLFTRGRLPDEFNIIGLARRPHTLKEYVEFVSSSLAAHGHSHFKEKLISFCGHISYISGSFEDDSTYESLHKTLETFDNKTGVCTNKLFYLAVPPEHYKLIFTKLHEHKLHETCNNKDAWARILVEKPFGKDLKTAQALDSMLNELFEENQIFRIDHYLAKEAVQNILSFRFANTLLNSSWNNKNIEEIHIKMHETIDVGSRVQFYEDVGALRDVGQNHLLQLLALIAMDQPAAFDPKSIRDERAKVLGALIPYSKNNDKTQVIRAQYEGYKDIQDSLHNSETETFFELKTELNLERWSGVPFYISAGKSLNEAHVSVEIIFKDIATGLFETENCHTTKNSVLLTISPEQTMSIRLNAKAPGLGFQIETRELSFTCAKGDDEITNAYEKVLLDCIRGDQTLFTTTEEVLAAWKFIMSILDNWKEVPLQIYKKGSEGPENRLLTNTSIK